MNIFLYLVTLKLIWTQYLHYTTLIVIGLLRQQIYTSLFAYTVKSRYLEVDGTIFYKFKLPEVQINLQSGNLDL